MKLISGMSLTTATDGYGSLALTCYDIGTRLKMGEHHAYRSRLSDLTRVATWQTTAPQMSGARCSVSYVSFAESNRASLAEEKCSPQFAGTPTRRALVNFDLGSSVIPVTEANAKLSMAPSRTPTASSPRRQPQNLIIGFMRSPVLGGRALSPTPLNDECDRALPVPKTGTRGRIRLRFSHEPIWVKVGSAVLFRGEGRLRCVEDYSLRHSFKVYKKTARGTSDSKLQSKQHYVRTLTVGGQAANN
ncbi:hypothetical protein BC830DRAFT_544072 [Chytriomyces sp. MP71]|nr:hypothetical protein BC830DRAFT_544072 [Chytriomyces sp. MP71]